MLDAEFWLIFRDKDNVVQARFPVHKEGKLSLDESAYYLALELFPTCPSFFRADFIVSDKFSDIYGDVSINFWYRDTISQSEYF